VCGLVNVLKVSNLVPRSASSVTLQLLRNYLLQSTREVIGNINRGYGAQCASEHTVSDISQTLILLTSDLKPHSPVLHTRLQRMFPHSKSLVRHGWGTSTFQHDLHTRVLTITPTEYNTARPHSDADTMEMRSHFLPSSPHARSLAPSLCFGLPAWAGRARERGYEPAEETKCA